MLKLNVGFLWAITILSSIVCGMVNHITYKEGDQLPISA